MQPTVALAALLLLASGCLSASVTYTSTDQTGPFGNGANATVDRTPIATHDSIDLSQGGSHSYDFKVHTGHKHATANVRVVGPVDEGGLSPHSGNGVCLTYSREDHYDGGYSTSKGRQGSCGGGISIGSDQLREQNILAWKMDDTNWGTYQFTINAQPQVGTLLVDIVVDY